jgi:hypothetical protein
MQEPYRKGEQRLHPGLEFPPMQKGASFNLSQLQEDLDKKIAAHGAQ